MMNEITKLKGLILEREKYEDLSVTNKLLLKLTDHIIEKEELYESSRIIAVDDFGGEIDLPIGIELSHARIVFLERKLFLMTQAFEEASEELNQISKAKDFSLMGGVIK